ncbi:MAG: hypothetical protein JXB88_17825 [Spirochaetales bacterium]|nr:hypothetical protein [Spirochaetales bacterium]
MNKKLFFVLLCTLIVTGFSVNAQTMGDVNGSGTIDIVDALCIAQYYVGLTPTNFNPAYADVDGNGTIDVVDALLVAQCYVGLISCDFGGTDNITVRARGTMGGEIMELHVNGTIIATWTMSTGYEDFTASGSGSTIEVHFTNDDQLQNGMDIQVDYIIYDGVTYQAEDQETNTGVYINDSCGGSYSDMLQCNGYILFQTGPTDTPGPDTPTPTPGPETPTPTGGTFHIFLLLGQSNMAGYPKAQTADKVENSRIQVLGYDECSATGRHTDQWDIACPPLHECGMGAIGPGDWFAKTIIDRYPSGDTIGLIPCAISGEKIETFMKNGGSKYSWIINRAKIAQQAGGVIDGILFHQGESNNGESSWPGKVNTLVQDLKSDLGLGNIPFLAGELLYSGSCAGHNTLINQLPSVVSNCYVISASGLVVDPSDTQWKLHFGHDSQVTFGQRYAQKMIEALGL